MTRASLSGMTSKGTPRRTIRINDELWDAATQRAETAGESVSDVIRRALEDYTCTEPTEEA